MGGQAGPNQSHGWDRQDSGQTNQQQVKTAHEILIPFS